MSFLGKQSPSMAAMGRCRGGKFASGYFEFAGKYRAGSGAPAKTPEMDAKRAERISRDWYNSRSPTPNRRAW
jgi:hypothetical protein